MTAGEISGAFSVLFFYDVSDEIRLEELRKILGVAAPGREPAFRQYTPGYVQFAVAPVVEPFADSGLLDGESVRGSLAYYDYGVVSLKLEFPFQGGWDAAVELAARWMNAAELERRAAASIGRHIERAAPALVNPYAEHIAEDYFIFHLRQIDGEDGRPVTSDQLLSHCGDWIAQVVRGERARFSASEKAEILESRMSYYDTDLLVVGWTAALVYDTVEGAAPTMQLLEYANTQLLEFRHYDGVLTSLLTGVYRSLDEGTGFLGRWRLARKAERLNTIRLEVRELAERVDNSIKFLSDMFAARLYRLAAAKIGVPDYRRLVDQKLDSAGELYAFMMDQFHQGRAFILELMVVVILIIELFFLLRGKA